MPQAGTAVPVVSLDRVTKRFGDLRAVDALSIEVAPGTTLGMVGESGCGKSTVARLVLGLERPNEGTLSFRGQPYPRSYRGLREVRRHLSMVFQDPYESLDPRCTLGAIVTEPLRAHGKMSKRDADARVRELLHSVGMHGAPLDSRPSEYSGGGRQRVGIARALALDPQLVVCDEPTSALDVSIQAQILNLLLGLQAERGLAYLFISHDLDVVRRVSDTIVVLYAGAIMEIGPAEAVTGSPSHPYTQALLSAIAATSPDERRLAQRIRLREVGSDPTGTGCPFLARCPRAEAICHERPPLSGAGAHRVACHLAGPDRTRRGQP